MKKMSLIIGKLWTLENTTEWKNDDARIIADLENRMREIENTETDIESCRHKLYSYCQRTSVNI